MVADPATPPAVLAGVLAAVGNTPAVELRRLAPGLGCTLLAKLEALNPGGSIKDRPALRIVEEALAAGRLSPGGLVVESSSGNMGIGLAQACLYYGLRLICVVDPKASSTNVEILRAYGVEVDCVETPDPVSGDFLPARLARVAEWLQRFPTALWPNQYVNEDNANAHRDTTMAEIIECCGEVDYVFCATSTCGTARGCVDYVARHRLNTKIVAVDAVGSIIFGGERQKRLLPGMGAAIVPDLRPALGLERVVLVSDLESVVGCRRLLRREAIFAGASSGGVVAAALKLLPQVSHGRAVLILPDRGERYLDTVYSDLWVRENFGAVEPVWENEASA